MSFKTFVNFSIFQTFTNLPNIAYCNIIDPESKTQLTLPLFVCVCVDSGPARPIQPCRSRLQRFLIPPPAVAMDFRTYSALTE